MYTGRISTFLKCRRRAAARRSVEPFALAIDLFILGYLPVYSRAVLSRILAVVVAPSWTAVSMSSVARISRAADCQSEMNPTIQMLRRTGRLIAAAAPIARIRAVE